MNNYFKDYSKPVNDFIEPISDFMHYLNRLDVFQKNSINIDANDYNDFVELIAEVPGFLKNEIIISIDENILTISGTKPSLEKNKNAKIIFKEIKLKSFKRSFDVGHNINKTNIQATMENGLLIIKLEKDKSSTSSTNFSIPIQ